MQKRTLKVAILAALTVILVLSFAGVALADQTWSDLPDTVTAKYNVTDNQVASISEGFAGGLWKPLQSVTRAQFTKMAVAAFKVDLVNPATASYSDVPKTDVYYQWIEAAKAVGMVNGAATFNPAANITREQAIAIVVRYVAKINGYTLTTMYTPAEVTALLGRFLDAASVGSALKTEVAFAIDFGITEGNSWGNLAPQALLTRIQGAAFLIRAQTKVSLKPVVPAAIQVVTADKGENLIGQNHQVTFKVTQADGSAAGGVLVDFDTLTGGPFEVGNISAEAAMTSENGEVTINLNSTEPGTQRVSAAVAGLTAKIVTQYWVVLDEVYITDLTREAENNAGEAHTWGARVVVFGPGARSTSVQDWYNAISTATFDPTSIKAGDGVDAGADGWDFAFEKHLLAMHAETPRTLAGVSVEWSIVDWYSASTVTIPVANADIKANYGPLAGGNIVELKDGSYHWDTVTSVKFGNLAAAFESTGDPHVIIAKVPAVTLAKIVDVVVTDADGAHNLGTYKYMVVDVKNTSVGNITAVEGAAITAAKTAAGVTNAAGLSTIKIESTVTGKTKVQAVATYVGNPYPKDLFNHATFTDNWDHSIDWDKQPTNDATAMKTWIPHVIGTETPPISPAYAVNNTGEYETFTLTLNDTYGNVIPDYTVQWWIQGVGEFKTDLTSWSGVGEQNKDVDVTDAKGQSSVWVTSAVPGQTIVHCKVMDKYGLPYHEWNVVKQWYSIDDVRFLPTTDADGLVIAAENKVNVPHTFTVAVSGAKYVYSVYDLNGNGLRDDQLLIGDREDMAALAGHTMTLAGALADKAAGADVPAGVPFTLEASATPTTTWYVRFADIELAAGEFWADRIGAGKARAIDGVAEVWFVLAGKGVNFFTNIGGPNGTYPQTRGNNSNYGALYTEITSNTPNPTVIDAPNTVQRVGSITGFATAWVNKVVGGVTYDYDAVTDANGQATVTVNSTVKGMQYVWAVVDYPENPQNGNAALPLSWFELRYAQTSKLWTPDATTPNIRVFANAAVPYAPGDVWTNPIIEWSYTSLGSATLLIGAPDMATGTAVTGVTATVSGGVVTFGGTALPSGVGYTAGDVNQFVYVTASSGAVAHAHLGTTGPTDNQVAQIDVTAGGFGYLTAPVVTIGAPNIAGGVQATATASLGTGSSVVSITVTNPGSGYTSEPTVSFSAAAGLHTHVGTISGVNSSGAVTALTPMTASIPDGLYNVTVPAPLRANATGTATVVSGVVTAVNLTYAGAGYSIIPAVNISGTGSGALAHATIANGVVATLVRDAGGSGYDTGVQASGTADDENPNREVIGVQIFDQYGNALPDYFVTWEILQQGTTTAGTIDTYHPYAHFMDNTVGIEGSVLDPPAHEEPSASHHISWLAGAASGLPGTGDRQPFVDSNPLWDSGTPRGTGDDDMAWGWTLDGQINNTLDLASAAHVTLVLDESHTALQSKAHITSIINVKVYTPTGALLEDFEVTKEWSNAPAVLTKLNLAISTTSVGPWSPMLTTSLTSLHYRVLALDQYDNLSTASSVKIKVTGPSASVLTVGNVAGSIIGGFAAPGVPGTYTLTPWQDNNPANGLIDAGELTGVPVTLVVN